ncbi:succinate--hydroxymethylglutarate CoA-transferase isoform X1 [Heptranchias perlo]|uniref:succinate--hydroxymethylglutarate CoA-transferase isoform X1 n=1 Tax=Heptranchias perlo TaxID=212740 RepID=UPI00355AB207
MHCYWVDKGKGIEESGYRLGNVKPLEGVKIIDLTRVLAGPFATMILGDLGAEIIKVERPGAGDDTRAWGPPFVGTESAYFLSVNRNKKSIAVNLKDPCGARIIKDLASVCDVLIENYVPGKLSEMGLGYGDIREIAPHIVYCSITGYGQTGPMSQRAGYDSVACAMSGLMHITGPQHGDPVRPGVAMTDLATGLYSHGAIMAGLLQKEKTGKGQHIDCNLLSSQVACLSHIAANYLTSRKEAKRWGTAHESIVPYQAFETKDGYLVVGTGNDQQFSVVCKILSLSALSQDPTYKTNKLRVQNRRELIDVLCARFLDKTTQDWLQLFEGSGVPYGPINSIQQAFSEPQDQTGSTVALGISLGDAFADFLEDREHKPAYWQLNERRVIHNDLILEMDHPTAGSIAVPGPAVRFSNFKVSNPKPPPLIGQHTVEVLKTMLAYSESYINELLAAGTVTQHALH